MLFDLTWNVFKRMFYVCLRRMCSLLLMDGIFFICPLGPFGLRYGSITMPSHCFFPLDDLSIVESEIWMPPTIMVLFYLSTFRSVTAWLTYSYFGSPMWLYIYLQWFYLPPKLKTLSLYNILSDLMFTNMVCTTIIPIKEKNKRELYKTNISIWQ